MTRAVRFRSALCYAIGREAEQVFNTFVFEEGEDEDYDSVVEKLNTYFIPKVNVIHERANFYLRTQKTRRVSRRIHSHTL